MMYTLFERFLHKLEFDLMRPEIFHKCLNINKLLLKLGQSKLILSTENNHNFGRKNSLLLEFSGKHIYEIKFEFKIDAKDKVLFFENKKIYFTMILKNKKFLIYFDESFFRSEYLRV